MSTPTDYLVLVLVLLHSHCLYRFLDGKKTSLRGNHRNLKQQKNFNSREGFFRKFPFCTFSCINSGFGRPWDVLWIFFSSCHFHNALKVYLWLKIVSNFMTSSKVPFWQFFNFSEMVLMSQCIKFEFFVGQNHSFKV